MLRRQKRGLGVVVFLAAVVITSPALAGFVQYGAGMQVLLDGQVQNGGVYLQSRNTWSNSIPTVPPQAQTTASFQTPACDNVTVSRLLMTVWGGTNTYTCGLEVTFNGTPIASLGMGGTGDSNPSFQAGQANVYGTGFGVWTVSVPVPANLVHKDGLTANDVVVNVTDPAQKFDGRISQVSLFSVYQQASLNNTLEYQLAEGSGDIYRGTTGALKSRTIPLASVSTTGVDSAELYALYSYGDYGQNDRLYFNGTQLGGDDIANHQNNYTALTYVPDLVSFDVTGLLGPSNSVTFSADAADGIPGTLESSLRPSWAVLEVTHSANEPPVPEPLTMATFASGLLALAWKGRRRT